jgi:hypothetical protein
LNPVELENWLVGRRLAEKLANGWLAPTLLGLEAAAGIDSRH